MQQLRAGDAGNVLPLARIQQLVRARRDPAGRVRVGGAAVRRVVLEAAVARRVVAGGHDDAVSQSVTLRAQVRRCAVRAQNCDGHGGGRRVGAARINARVDAGGCEDLQGGAPRGFTQGVRVTTDEQRTIDALRCAVLDDRRGDGDDVRLVELAVQRGAAVARCSECDALSHVGRVGNDVIVSGDDIVDVDEVFWKGTCASSIMHKYSVARYVHFCVGPSTP